MLNATSGDSYHHHQTHSQTPNQCKQQTAMLQSLKKTAQAQVMDKKSSLMKERGKAATQSPKGKVLKK